MPSGSVGATLYAIYKTAAITVPSLVDAMLGRLTREGTDRRLADWSRCIVRRAGPVVVGAVVNMRTLIALGRKPVLVPIGPRISAPRIAAIIKLCWLRKLPSDIAKTVRAAGKRRSEP